VHDGAQSLRTLHTKSSEWILVCLPLTDDKVIVLSLSFGVAEQDDHSCRITTAPIHIFHSKTLLFVQSMFHF